MRSIKTITACITAVLLMFICFAVPVKADSIFDSAKEVTNGKKYTAKLSEKEKNHSYKVNVNSKGTLIVSITSDVKYMDFYVYDSDGTQIDEDSKEIKTGNYKTTWDGGKTSVTDGNTGTFKGDIKYSVKKGTYYLYFKRTPYLEHNGKFSFSVKTPDSSSSSSVSAPKATVKLYMDAGSKVDLGAVSSGKDVTASWTSSDSKVAKVSSKGTVTAVSSGTCTITWKNGSTSFIVLVEVN